MKYAMLVGDGMADEPIDELGKKTPLEYAATPHMDALARGGRVGRVLTVPDGLTPGSDVANLSLLGYDPKRFYAGRAPIEAASMGLKLTPRETAFRCNLVKIRDAIMADYSSGHIETADARELVKELQKLDTGNIHFFPGTSYRHLVVFADFPEGECICTPPHDISGKPVGPYLPRGSGADVLADLSAKAHQVLASAKANRERIDKGKTPATDIWLWGQGKAMSLPSLFERFGIHGSVISAVDLVRGLGKLAGCTVRVVEGATGYLGTNYAGKVAAAAQALDEGDFVFLHVEAPDETSHEGSLEKKIRAIEEFDANVVGEVVKLRAQHADLRIIVTPDHATLVSSRTHHAQAVPFAVAGQGISAGGAGAYCEKTAERGALYSGPSLFEEFMRGAFANCA